MTDLQLYLAIGIPVLLNAAMFGLLVMHINSQLDGMRREFNDRFAAINQRFDDMRNLWLAELHRVEGILDARLKHLEEEKNR